jgi:ATP/maltotriose-dependent transcriptional regulator MalT
LVAQALQHLSPVNRMLRLFGEEIRQAKEAFKIFEWIEDTTGQAHSLYELSCLLLDDCQPDAAENAAFRGIKLISEKDRGHLFCDLTQAPGIACRLKGKNKRAIHLSQTALRIASPPNWRDVLVWTTCDLAESLQDEGEFDDANTHPEQAKSDAVDRPYPLGFVMYMQAGVWH